MEPRYLNFIMGGREYSATFNEEGECCNIYDMVEHRYLKQDSDSGFRERPSIWTAAYTMLEDMSDEKGRLNHIIDRWGNVIDRLED